MCARTPSPLFIVNELSKGPQKLCLTKELQKFFPAKRIGFNEPQKFIPAKYKKFAVRLNRKTFFRKHFRVIPENLIPL